MCRAHSLFIYEMPTRISGCVINLAGFANRPGSYFSTRAGWLIALMGRGMVGACAAFYFMFINCREQPGRLHTQREHYKSVAE